LLFFISFCPFPSLIPFCARPQEEAEDALGGGESSWLLPDSLYLQHCRGISTCGHLHRVKFPPNCQQRRPQRSTRTNRTRLIYKALLFVAPGRALKSCFLERGLNDTCAQLRSHLPFSQYCSPRLHSNFGLSSARGLRTTRTHKRICRPALPEQQARCLPAYGISYNYPCNRPWRIPHCLENRLIDGGKVVSPAHRLHFTPQKLYVTIVPFLYYSNS
jgi:hypothetical protein